MSTANHDGPPMVTGQCAEVLHLLRTLQPVPSFILTADHAIPEAAARIHDLRAKGYHVLTMILPEFQFRGGDSAPRGGVLDGHTGMAGTGLS